MKQYHNPLNQIDSSSALSSMGSLVAIENITDPHSQRFLRGHDMPVRER